MHLKIETVMPQCWVKKIEVEISREDPKIKVTVRTALTPDLCDAFGCHDLVYAGKVPRSGVEKLVLEGEQIDVEFHLKNDNLGFYAIANSIGKYVVKMEGTGPVLEFKIAITGYAELVVDLATKVKVDPVEITLKPAQMDLGLQNKGDGPCVDCNNDIGFAAFIDKDTGETREDRSLHLSGQPCANYKVPQPSEAGEKEEVGATLAPAAVMGGTHAKPKQRRRGAAAVEETPDEEEVPEFTIN